MPKLLEAVHYRFHGNTQKPGIERIQEEEEDISRSRLYCYSNDVHRLQIRPIVHN